MVLNAAGARVYYTVEAMNFEHLSSIALNIDFRERLRYAIPLVMTMVIFI